MLASETVLSQGYEAESRNGHSSTALLHTFSKGMSGSVWYVVHFMAVVSSNIRPLGITVENISFMLVPTVSGQC